MNEFGDEGFELRESREGTTIVLAVHGDLDIVAAERLRERLGELKHGEAPVFLNLANLEFIDSTGVACITRAVRDARDNGWELTVGRELQPQVQRLVELVDGEKLFWPSLS